MAERDRALLLRVAGWVHARRKFHEAMSDDAARAKEIIALIAFCIVLRNLPVKADSRLRPVESFAKGMRRRCWIGCIGV